MGLSTSIRAGPSSGGVDDVAGWFGEDMVLGGCGDVDLGGRIGLVAWWTAET